MKDLKIRIAGTAGQGVISAGDILSYAVARKGFYVTTYRAFPSEIRGDGKCYYQLRISEQRARTAGLTTDVLINLDELSAKRLETVNKGGVVIADSDNDLSAAQAYPELIKYFVPITKMAKEVSGERSKNALALGIAVGLIKNLDLHNQVILDMKKRYEKKPKEVVEANIKAFERGYDFALNELERHDSLEKASMQTSGPKLIMSGNEAIALGAMVAGCRFFAGYPITPATEIMEWLAREMPKVGGKMVQCEDEIAAICEAIGASYGGVKAMTATSGPGFSLMQESIGLASMAELPLVIVDVMRGGPSTGIPTKTEQSDLMAAMFGTHGECPKIVLAPINVEDCFKQTINAFNFAEKYQTPVILLSDATMGPRRECVDLIDFESVEIVDRLKPDAAQKGNFKRYENTKSGISPLPAPGDEGFAYTATGLEHKEDSTPVTDPDVHKMMIEKRFRKLQTASGEFTKAKRFGVEGAKIGIISWGSTSGAVIEAIEMANACGIEVEVMYPRTLYPMPTPWIKEFLEGKDIVITIEANFNAQLKSLIVERCNHINRGLRFVEFLKYEGNPFTAEEIFEKIKEVSNVYEEEIKLSSVNHVF